MCLEAAVIAEAEVERLTAELQNSTEGAKQLADYEVALKDNYPTWYSEICPGGRRLVEEVPGGALAAGRRMSTLLTCSPPSAPTIDVGETMKVAFSKDTEQAHCSDLTTPTGQPMTTVGLAEQCSAFCGSEAVPLLVGSIDFGFNQTAMDTVCLNSDLVTTDSAKVTQCLNDAEAMVAVEIKMAAFITALTALELVKVEYEKSVAEQLSAMKDKIAEKAEAVLKGAKANEKAADYAAFLKDEVLNGMMGNSVEALKYKQALERLGVSVGSLKTTAQASLQAFQDFLSDCSDVYTGKGSSGEYLLDQCSQTSDECIDSEWGRHVGCCCGYMPFMAVGQERVSFSSTIPGLGAEALKDSEGKARVGSRLRRRMSENVSDNTYIDICGAAWESNKEPVADFLSATPSDEPFLRGWLAAKQERYPDADLCAYGGWAYSKMPSLPDWQTPSLSDLPSPSLTSSAAFILGMVVASILCCCCCCYCCAKDRGIWHIKVRVSPFDSKFEVDW